MYTWNGLCAITLQLKKKKLEYVTVLDKKYTIWDHIKITKLKQRAMKNSHDSAEKWVKMKNWVRKDSLNSKRKDVSWRMYPTDVKYIIYKHMYFKISKFKETYKWWRGHN